MQLDTTIPESAMELINSAKTRFSNVLGMVIETIEDYNRAAQTLKDMKSARRDLDAKRKELTKPLDDRKGEIMEVFKEPIGQLDKNASALAKKIQDYADEQERKRKAEEARLAAQARKEQEKLEQRAAKAEEKGQVEKAEVLREQAQTAPTGISLDNGISLKGTGVSERENWSGEVTDKKALIKAVAAGKAPLNLLEVNTKVLNQLARSLKSELNYPGVRAVSKKKLAA